ncbi:hypothetical protein CRG98_049351, partial [Punica granatum]
MAAIWHSNLPESPGIGRGDTILGGASDATIIFAVLTMLRCLPEFLVYVALIELPCPDHQNEGNQTPEQSCRRDDKKGRLVALHAGA